MGEPSDEELDRPMMWRFWRALPLKGKIGVFLGSWYTWPILNRVRGVTKAADLEQSLDRAKQLETMLVDEGALIIKFWLHLSKEKQEKRLKSLEKNPLTRWRVTDRDWKRFKAYDKFQEVHEQVIRQTSTADAPWLIVEGEDANYRSLTVGKVILKALRDRLDQEPAPPRPVAAPTPMPPVDDLHLLRTLDMTQAIGKDAYKDKLEKEQNRLSQLTRDPKFKYMSVIAVFEGNDAAGKGGSIRRVVRAIDPRRYKVHSVAAPTDEEKARPYLWRFWRHLPPAGRFAIFDRTWYGRVLVERVEGFADPAEWQRAYDEINDFEAQMTERGYFVAKFWLHISPEEQLARFQAREQTPYKQHKITEEDYRNREKWDEYVQAIDQMVLRTTTDSALWT